MNKGVIITIVIAIVIIAILVVVMMKKKAAETAVTTEAQAPAAPQTLKSLAIQTAAAQLAAETPETGETEVALNGKPHPVRAAMAVKHPVIHAVGCTAKCDALHPFNKTKRNSCKSAC